MNSLIELELINMNCTCWLRHKTLLLTKLPKFTQSYNSFHLLKANISIRLHENGESTAINLQSWHRCDWKSVATTQKLLETEKTKNTFACFKYLPNQLSKLWHEHSAAVYSSVWGQFYSFLRGYAEISQMWINTANIINWEQTRCTCTFSLSWL